MTAYVAWLMIATAPVNAPARPWHLGAAAGYLYWQQAHGDRRPGFALRVLGGRDLSGWLSFGEHLVTRAALEVSWRGDETRDLRFAHTVTTLTAAGGGTYRYLLLRAEALVEIGATVETTQLAEAGATDRAATRASPSFGGHGGLGLVYRDVAALMLRGGARTRAGRLDVFVSLGVDWLF